MHTAAADAHVRLPPHGASMWALPHPFPLSTSWSPDVRYIPCMLHACDAFMIMHYQDSEADAVMRTLAEACRSREEATCSASSQNV